MASEWYRVRYRKSDFLQDLRRRAEDSFAGGNAWSRVAKTQAIKLERSC